MTDQDIGMFSLLRISSEDDLVHIEWQMSGRHLSLFVGPHGIDFVKAWGPNIHSQMSDGTVGSAAALADLWEVYFFRAGGVDGPHADKNARLVGDAMVEIAKWLESGVAFDLALERQDEDALRAQDEAS